MTTDILYKNLTYRIRGCFFEVYNKLGCGFKESVYHKALACEFQLQGIIFETEEELPVFYKINRSVHIDLTSLLIKK